MREFPDHMYPVVDPKDTRIQELEAELLILRAAYAVARKRLKKYEKKKGRK